MKINDDGTVNLTMAELGFLRLHYFDSITLNGVLMGSPENAVRISNSLERVVATVYPNPDSLADAVNELALSDTAFSLE